MASLTNSTTTISPPEPDYLSLESPPPTPTETMQITEMQHLLGGLQGELLLPYQNYDEIISKWSFLRYLRGLDHDVKEAVKVFQEHLQVREKYKLNEIRAKVLNTRQNYDASDFENGTEFMKSMPLTYNAGSDKHGHIYCYVPIGEQDTWELEKGLGFEKYKEFCLHEWVARDIQMNTLSHQHNRLIKLILIIDLGGLSLTSSQVRHGAKKQFDKEWQALLETKPENTARWYFINVPWFGVKMYNTFGKVTFPANTLRKTSLYGTDYRQQLLGQIDLSTLQTLIISKRRKSLKGKSGAEEDNANEEVPLIDETVLKAGSAKEILIEVTKDMVLIKWKLTATVRDITFSGVFYRTSMYTEGTEEAGERKNGDGSTSTSGGTQEDVVVKECLISSKDGEIVGEYDVAKETGLIVFELSNKHSWMRQNGVKYEIEIVMNKDVEDEHKGGEDGLTL